MIGTFDYQERIDACAWWAERAANDRAKELWKEMERFWRQRADRCQLEPASLPRTAPSDSSVDA